MSENQESEKEIITESKQLSIGEQFREKRETLKISIERAASYLKIKVRDIDAIEHDNFTVLDKHIYVSGLIKSYAKFLKIDYKTIEEQIRQIPIKSNLQGKKLLNIGVNNALSPNKEVFFNFLLISSLLFFVLLALYSSYEKKDRIITTQEILKELNKWSNE